MKSILISIRPRWCEKIVSGKKTIEVRKTRPKCETPFKCYIYCTKTKRIGLDEFYADPIEADLPFGECGNEKVIGEFICDRITDMRDIGGDEFFATSCMSLEDWLNYTNYTNHVIWAWHISDLKIYDEPKELSEFHKPCTPKCNFSEECGGAAQIECLFALSRPPLSWCYVEGA